MVTPSLRIRRETTVQQVIMRLKELIVAGQWSHGQKLPPEKDLAAQLGVSRTVLRESVQALAALGILVPRHGDGVYVNTLELHHLLKPLQFALTMGPAAVEHAYEARLAIEPAIAALASEYMAPTLQDELEHLIERAKAVVDDAGAFAALDEEMHGLLAKATGNPFLTTVMTSLGELTRAFRQLTCAVPGALASALQDWEAILTAIRARDRMAAAKAIEAHLISALEAWRQGQET